MSKNLQQPVLALCELAVALGIDPIDSPITALTIRSAVRGPVTVTIESFVTVEQTGEIKKVLSRYRLQPIEDTPAPCP